MNVPHSSTTEKFWAACKERQLLLQHCLDCNKPFYYPRTGCPRCGGTRLEWRQMKGTGTIYSFSHVHLALGGYKSWEAEVPFTLVQIELDEGPRMLSRLVGKANESVKIGDRVSVAFTEREGETLPYFSTLA